MNTNPMQSMQDANDPGDKQGSYQQCEQEIEELESRVAKIEQMLGIQPPPDNDDQESDGLSQAIAGNANPFLKAKSL